MTKKLKKTDEKGYADETYIIIPPDGGWGWVIVGAAFMCNFVADGVMYSFGLFLEDIADTFNKTETEVSLANSLMTGFYFFFGPVICSMINRFGYRVVGFTGGIIASGCFVISSFAPDILILIFSHGLMGGIGFGMLYMPSVIAVGYYFEKWRGVATSMALTGTAAGSILFPPLILFVLAGIDWRMKFLCFAAFAVFCSFCTLLFKPLIPVAVPVERGQIAPENVEDDSDSVSMTPSRFRYNNQNFPKAGARGSFVSLTRNTGSPFSFKSYASTVKSLYRGNRYMLSDSDTLSKSRRCCRNCNVTLFDLCCCCCLGKRCATDPTRPMYRDDILYSASLMNLNEYKATKTIVNQPHDYNVSVSRLPTKKDLSEDDKCCICCPEAVKRTLITMLDFSLMKSLAFTLVALSGFFTLFGYYVPITYITAKCMRTGMDEASAGYLISTIGLSNLVGRIISAVLSSIPHVKSLPITITAVMIAGCSTVGSVFSNEKIVQFSYCALYGASTAIILSLRPILVVELFGLEKLTNSFGLSMMFYGLACLIGIPVAGILYDWTKSYDVTFFCAGGSIVLSAFMLMLVPPIMKWEARRAEIRKVEAANKRYNAASTSAKHKVLDNQKVTDKQKRPAKK